MRTDVYTCMCEGRVVCVCEGGEDGCVCMCEGRGVCDSLISRTTLLFYSQS